jgi:hypothetical protein
MGILLYKKGFMMNTAQKYAAFFEKIDKNTSIEAYKEFFDANSYFEDPFQKVYGINKIYNIFEDMYAKFYNPRFEVQEVVSQGSIAYIKWNFIFQMDKNSDVTSFEGVSRVEFHTNAKVKSHVDFWDAGANVYEKIPLLGSIIRMIKRKIHA